MPPRRVHLTRVHLVLIWVVVIGTTTVAGIGFAGSYAAVHQLALAKGFGQFSYVFPIGIDVGICCLLALDILLTWIRIPFPLLRQTAWLLTAGTIVFNAAAGGADLLSIAMHGVIPCLFVVAVEAARHAIGRIADITADRHMEGVRLTRWLLDPLSTFLLWRRMKLYELRSYETVIRLEQQRLVYRTRLRSRFGRGWRRKAPVESLLPLRLARFGVPLDETAPAGLSAAGITAPLLPAARATAAPPDVAPVAHGGRCLQEGAPAAAGPPPEEGRDDRRHGNAQQTAAEPPRPGAVPEPAPPDREAGAAAGRQGGAQEQAAAPAESDDPVPGTADGRPDAEPAEQPVPGSAPDEDVHRRKLAAIAKKTDAVRYAITITGSLDKKRLGDWLTAHGCPVNRGSVHKVVVAEEKRRRAEQQQPGTAHTDVAPVAPPEQHGAPAPAGAQPAAASAP